MKIIIKNNNDNIFQNPNIKIIETTEFIFNNQIINIEKNDIPVIKFTDTKLIYFVKDLDNLYDRKSRSEVLLDITIDNLELTTEDNKLSNDISNYELATTPLTRTELVLVDDGTGFKKVPVSELGGSDISGSTYIQHPSSRYTVNSDLTWKGYSSDIFFFTSFPTTNLGTGLEPDITGIATQQGIVSSESTKVLKELEFNIFNASAAEIELAIYKSDYDTTNNSIAYNVRKIHGSSLIVLAGDFFKTIKIIKNIIDSDDTPSGMVSKWTIYFKNISGGNFLRYYINWKFD